MFVAKPLTLERLEAVIREALAIAARSGANGKAFSAAAAADTEPIAVVREQMLSWVSHEIRSPLSAALMAAELVRRGIRSGEPADVLEGRVAKIIRQLKRMDELAGAILDAAQLQDGKLRLDLETFDMAEHVRSLVGAWRDLYPEYSFEIEDGTPGEVEGDRERLRQILDNLISNAIKYGGPDKAVRVGVVVNDAEVVVSVHDRGQGIPGPELPHIFDRFHRVAGQGGRGHGLGLYISAALARLHGGTITVESEVGRGSTFSLVIPRRDGVER
jgi:signal transduction histidine kinase